MANLGTFNIGDAPAVMFYVFDDTGVQVDASTFKVVTRNPSGTETSYTYPHANLTKPTTGAYKFVFPQFTSGQNGGWYIRSNATTPTRSTEDSITVLPTAYTTPLP